MMELLHPPECPVCHTDMEWDDIMREWFCWLGHDSVNVTDEEY